MEKHFNKLSPAEHERLSLLLEECGECIQAIGKIMRHGYENHHPDRTESNRSELSDECAHVFVAIEMMVEAGDLDPVEMQNAKVKKQLSVKPWLNHQ